MADTNRKKITDVRVLAALAHPVRLAILSVLLGGGERTATQCAEVVDATPSACSYHLRHLERFGLVTRAESPDGGDRSDRVDGRTRPWRASASGFDFGSLRSSGPPELIAASAALTATSIDENSRLARRYLADLSEIPDEWQRVATFSTYGLLVTADELREVTEAIDAIVRPLRNATRTNAPAGARPVSVTLEAFPRTDLR